MPRFSLPYESCLLVKSSTSSIIKSLCQILAFPCAEVFCSCRTPPIARHIQSDHNGVQHNQKDSKGEAMPFPCAADAKFLPAAKAPQPEPLSFHKAADACKANSKNRVCSHNGPLFAAHRRIGNTGCTQQRKNVYSISCYDWANFHFLWFHK